MAKIEHNYKTDDISFPDQHIELHDMRKEVEKSFINEFGEGEFDYRTNGDRRCKFFADDNNWDTLSIDAKWVE